MSAHFCKVGKTKSLSKLIELKDLKDITVQFIEVVYNPNSKDLDVAS